MPPGALRRAPPNRRRGRPTRVAVTAAVHRGGLRSATTAVPHTSVGTAAVDRLLRTVAYQDVPQALPPEAPRDADPPREPGRTRA